MTRPPLRLVRIDPDDVGGDVSCDATDDGPPSGLVRLLVPSTEPTAAHLAWCDEVEAAFDRLDALVGTEDP